MKDEIKQKLDEVYWNNLCTDLESEIRKFKQERNHLKSEIQMYKEWAQADEEEINALSHDGEYDQDLKATWNIYREVTN